MPEEPLAPSSNQNSNEATIESNPLGAADSTCNNNVTSSSNDNNYNNNDNAETSALTSNGDGEKSLGFADELMETGSKALKDGDFVEAAECFSRALEIRVAHYGELAPECVSTYYKYGCALLYKAQEEADPLATIPKKDAPSQSSDKDGDKSTLHGESSVASVSSTVDQDGCSHLDEESNDGSGGKDQEDDGEDADAEDLAEADEDESDLDLAWKMLDIARAIVEKQSVDTVEKVDILSALAEVALEREDIETSLSDYQKALSILEKLVEPDSRQIAELVQRLMDEVKMSSESASSDGGVSPLTSESHVCKTLADKEAEIKTLSGLSSELEKKLEDLQQLAANPTSILTEILGIASAKAKEIEKAASSAAMSSTRIGTVTSNAEFDSPTASTAHTNGAAGVTHLGVVGRGVKRVSMNVGTAQSSPMKKPALDSSEEKRDGTA